MSIITLSHIGFQCPWYSITRNNLVEYCKKNNHVFKDEELAVSDIEKIKGFPFAVFIDGAIVTGSPIFEFNVNDLFEQKFKDAIINDEDLNDGKIDTIKAMDKNIVRESIILCCNGNSGISEKENWYIANKEEIVSFVGYSKNVSKVIMESFLCNDNGKKKLAISCFYSNDGKYDYKKSMFQECRTELKDIGINEVEIIVGENSYYPNGKRSHFEKMGFSKIGSLGSTYLLNRGCDNIYKYGITL